MYYSVDVLRIGKDRGPEETTEPYILPPRIVVQGINQPGKKGY